jgi:uncharacterized membrane protein
MVLLIFFVIIPFISIKYDLARTYQQMIIILSILSAYGLYFILRLFKLSKNKIYIIMGLIFVLNFLFSSGFSNQIMGGQETSLRLNNQGLEFERYITSSYDQKSAEWMVLNQERSYEVYGDGYANTKLYPYRDISYLNRIRKELFFSIYKNNAYIYARRTNIQTGVAFFSYRGSLLSYQFPKDRFISLKKKVYSNGGSEIFL